MIGQRLPIRLRMAILTGIVVGIASGIIGGLTLSNAFAAIDQDFNAALGEETAEYLISYENGLPLSTLSHPISNHGVPSVGVFDDTGRLIDATDQEPLPLTADIALNEYVTIASESGEEFRVLVLPIGNGAGSVLATMISLETLKDRNRGLAITAAALVAVAAAAAAWGAYLISGLALKPIAVLTRSAALIGRDPSGRRLDVPAANDEVRNLAETLNEGLGLIDDVTEKQRRFVTDASHELRTPLARLRADVDLARRPTRTHEEIVAALNQIDEHAAHLTSLADSLLGTLAPMGTGSPSPTSTTANELLANVKARIPEDESVVFELAEEFGESVLLCDAQGVVNSVSNLVQNALRHGAPPVLVSARRWDTLGVEFTVRDHGPGIPLGLQETVLEPFSQGPEVTGGTGLGLTIVRSFAEDQGGALLIEDSEPGCRMVLRIPSSPLAIPNEVATAGS